MMRCIQSGGESFKPESGMEMRCMHQTEKVSKRKDGMGCYNDNAKRKYHSMLLSYIVLS